MAMGNYCYLQGIECPYATVLGRCQDDIYEDYGLCEMRGDKLPPKDWGTDARREYVSHILHPEEDFYDEG